MADPAYIVDGVLTDGEAWVGVASTTLGSDAASVTFTSTDDGQVGDWSQYMDLVLVCYYRTTFASVNVNLTLNFNNASTDFSYQILRGNGSAASAVSGTTNGRWDPAEGAGASATANVFASAVIHTFDVNSGKYKPSIARGASGDHSSTNSYTTLHASTWKSQAAISEIDLWSRTGGSLASGSRFDLFGVLPRMVS